MLKTIVHGMNLIRNRFRDVGVSAKRSDKWPTVEHHFRAEHSTCAACGGKHRLNVHHVMPFHLDPSKELDPTNLITLCMGEKECHLHIGHGGSFKQYNPNVRKDAAEALAHPKKFDAIVKQAMTNRKVN
jgi:5-methylcytosine-specific restriction endonuclease McrA